MPLVSIIVPVYKVEKYLKRCVNSLLNQSLRDIEIILVDDGSPDNSGKICDKLKKKDCRIKVIHKNNGGLSSARNVGLKIAQGQYIGFVDSDDDVALNMYENMYNVAKEKHVDIVMADYKRISMDGTYYLKTSDIPGGLYKKEQIRKKIFPNLIMRESIEYGPLLSVCQCLYRTEFLHLNNLYFDEEVRWSEDNIFSAIAGYCCERFYYMKGEGFYHYYQNQGTITTSYRSGAWKVYCTMNEHLHNFFDPIKDFDFSRQLKLHMIYYACNCIGQELTLPKLEAKRGIRNILETRQLRDSFTDFKMPRVGIKLKIQLYLMKYRQTDLLYRIKKAKD